MTRSRALALAAAALLLGLIALLWQEIPHWRIGGARSTGSLSVTHLPAKRACPRPGSSIAIIGDSHVSGSRLPQGAAAFGTVMERQLAHGIEITRYGIGGGTAIGGERRWRTRALPETDLVILAYGTNDAAPRGWLRDKRPVPVPDYKAALTRQIAHWRASGKDVVLLAPPPGGSAAITARVTPYRMAARDVGRMLKVAVFDPADAFASCPAVQPVLISDGLHMNAAGHACLGKWLAHQLCPPLS